MHHTPVASNHDVNCGAVPRCKDSEPVRARTLLSRNRHCNWVKNFFKGWREDVDQSGNSIRHTSLAWVHGLNKFWNFSLRISWRRSIELRAARVPETCSTSQPRLKNFALILTTARERQHVIIRISPKGRVDGLCIMGSIFFFVRRDCAVASNCDRQHVIPRKVSRHDFCCVV